MKEKKLYVGSLPYSFDNAELERLFSTVGTVVSARVIMDRETGRSKGFGFVEMSTSEDADRAVKELNGTTHGERTIVVNPARPEKARTGGGGNRERDRW